MFSHVWTLFFQVINLAARPGIRSRFPDTILDMDAMADPMTIAVGATVVPANCCRLGPAAPKRWWK